MLGRNRYQDGCVVLAMRLKRSVGLWILASLVASCGAAPSVATGKAAVVAQAMTAAADAPVYAPVLERNGIHSEAEAREVADQALDLASASRRVCPSRPGRRPVWSSRVDPSVDPIMVTRWESVPGSVTDVAPGSSPTDLRVRAS